FLAFLLLHICSCSLLNSFPTRRSSDLLLLFIQGAPYAFVHPRLPRSQHHPRGGAPPPFPGQSGGGVVLQPPGAPVGDPLPPLPRDRKSTRLNTSHVSISYAVFCLNTKM